MTPAGNSNTFECTICGEASTTICRACTRDTCPNHLCGKCQGCSDCCRCDVPLDGSDAG